MSSPLDGFFKFKIGEYVVPRFPFAYNTTDWEGKSVTTTLEYQPFLVVTRVLLECPGGIQREYHLRPLHFQLGRESFRPKHEHRHVTFGKELFKMNEVELGPYVPAELSPVEPEAGKEAK